MKETFPYRLAANARSLVAVAELGRSVIKFMILRLLAAILAILISACISQHQIGVHQWEKKDVAGLTISLDDPVKEEWYSFNKGGSVSATFGEKQGWLASPLLFWKIQNGVLIIFDYDKKPFQTLTLIDRNKKILILKDHEDQVLRFKIH